MSQPCEEQDCTVLETGQCLLNNEPSACPRRVPLSLADAPDVFAEVAPITSPKPVARFPLSLTLTPTDARAMMASRYCHVVGVLGVPNAGKTAALVSLFLLLGRGKLSGFTFSDSRSLVAFNEISQGARHWNEDGDIPQELTVHTELADDRTAGFLHLQLEEGDQVLDLLLPDLPGEWSSSLVDDSRTDRLAFFARSDVIWVMVDGRQLADPPSRRWTIHRTKLMFARLADLVAAQTRVILVVTHRDEVEPHAASIAEITAEAAQRGFELTTHPIASFAKEGLVEPGAGIAELVAKVRTPTQPRPSFWTNEDMTAGMRSLLRFRNRSAEA